MTTKQRSSRYVGLSWGIVVLFGFGAFTSNAHASETSEPVRHVASLRSHQPSHVRIMPPQPARGDGRLEHHPADHVDPESEPRPLQFDLEVATQVPLGIGGQGTLELPGRILLQGGVSVMPASFGHMIHGLVARDSADTRISAALSNLLDDALVVRVGGGWRPFSSAGLEIMGGYTMVDLGASATTAEIRGLAGTALPVSIDPLIGPEGIRLNSRLHNVHVTLGWRWVAFDALVIRANLGFTKTLASNSDVQIDQQDAVAATVTNIVSPLLDDAYTRYGNLPTAGLSLGYRF